MKKPVSKFAFRMKPAALHRGKQLRDHLYGPTPAKTIDDLTTLPKAMRQQLVDANVTVGAVTAVELSVCKPFCV
jgi:hypothetical protein